MSMCNINGEQQHTDGIINNVQEHPLHHQPAQRIFIGGLDPPNLTVEMVQKRIKASFEERFDLLSFDNNRAPKRLDMWGEDSRTFFFLTAKLKSSEEQMITPLEIISKQYHNVTWKGCSLQVEPAKLHFLQRLKIERMEAKEEEEEEERRKIQKQRGIKGVDTNSNSHVDENVSAKKRHLRIRKQHGEEAYMVDTKPIETKDWREVLDTIKKQRVKYQKHAEKLVLSRTEKKAKRNDNARYGSRSTNNNASLQSKVFLNRSVHFHFLDSHPSESTSKGCDGRPLNNSMVNSISTDENSDSSSHEIMEGDNSGVSGDKSTGSIDFGVTNCKTKELPTPQKTAFSKGEYEWSDSDDDSDLDECSNYNTKMSCALFTQSNHNAFDEFESAVQGQLESETIQKSNYIDEEMEDKDEFSSLEEDVISNLNCLKKIFPDMSVMGSRNGNIASKEETKHVKPGWKTGIIQRYDPTADSSTMYEIKQDENNDSGNDPEINNFDSEDSDDGSSDISSDTCDDRGEEISIVTDQTQNSNSREANLTPAAATKKDVKDQIYEQEKLEHIFQQKRSGGGTTDFQLSSLFQLDFKKQNVESPDPSKKEDTTQEFSFSFDVSRVHDKTTESLDNKDDNMTNTTKVDSSASYANENIGQSGEDPNNLSNEQRIPELKDRHGLFFSSSDLNLFEQQFFNMNEGVSGMLNMMDNKSKSDADQIQWKDERNILTLDWKRKLKHALARRNKKMKFR